MPYIWLKLDNAAKLYPGIISKRLTCVFRFSAYIKEGEVDVKRLKAAAEHALNRTPYYSMIIRRGLFWNYLEMPQKPQVSVCEEKPNCICAPMGQKDGEHLVRILYYKKKIALEASHILTDGAGALELFKDILGEYFNLPAPEHAEKLRKDYLFDKYAQVCRPTAPDAPMSKAWRTKLHAGRKLRATSFILDSVAVAKKAKSIGSTVGAYINALYVKSLIKTAISEGKSLSDNGIIRICMPINLRRIFKIQTPRNFYLSLYPTFRIDDSFGIDYLALSTNVQINSMLRRDTLNAQMSRNLEGEFNRTVRNIPRLAKSLALKIIYRTSAMKPISGIYSNMGKTALQSFLEDKISHMEFLPTPNPLTRTNIGAICLGKTLCITALSYTENPVLENIFRERLISENLEFKVYGNF